MSEKRDPKALSTEQTRRGGRGSDDTRESAASDPKRVERMWKREGRE